MALFSGDWQNNCFQNKRYFSNLCDKNDVISKCNILVYKYDEDISKHEMNSMVPTVALMCEYSLFLVSILKVSHSKPVKLHHVFVIL